MNKRTFLIATATVTLVLVGLTCVRAGLDGVAQPSAMLRTVDTTTGWAIAILGFVNSVMVLVVGDLQSHSVLLLGIAVVASSLIWGAIVERIVHFTRSKPRAM